MVPAEILMKIKIEPKTNGYYIAVLMPLESPEFIPLVDGEDLYFPFIPIELPNQYDETDIWCEETFGIRDAWGEIPVTGWKRMRNKYYFIEERNLELFVMRWS